jgi:catalase
MLTTTKNSCNNCIEPFYAYLAEVEFPLTETGELVLTISLINYIALLEQMTLSPAHMIVGVEPSSDDIF